jgi:hypothetical protein
MMKGVYILKTIKEPAKDIKVAAEVDICVIGGSCTGVFAAVRAARLGAKVAVIEKQNCFGGTATSGMVNVWHSLHNISGSKQIIAGLTLETIERLKSQGGCEEISNVNSAFRLDTELLKIELDQLVIENSIQPFLHTMYCAPCIENGELKGIIVENKNGRQAILAKFFIDASGDGDLAHDLGLPSYTHDIMQPPTPTFKLIGDLSGINLKNLLQEYGSEFGLPEDWGWGGPIPSIPNLFFRADTHVFNVDCSKADDLTYAEIEGRKQIKAVMQILEKYGGKKDKPARIAAICSHIGIRETRHFNSDYKLNQHDILYGINFDDAIANGTYRVDIHHAKGAGITFRSLDGEEIIFNDRTGPPIRRRWRKDNGYAEYYQVPFRALVQRKFANLIIAGRMINADEGAFGAVRVMVNLNQIGEAAGVAAYIAVSTDKEIWNIDTNLLRNELKKGGSIIL